MLAVQNVVFEEVEKLALERLQVGFVTSTQIAHTRSADLPQIQVPTLVIGARYDTMDPAHMEWMAGQFPLGTLV